MDVVLGPWSLKRALILGLEFSMNLELEHAGLGVGLFCCCVDMTDGFMLCCTLQYSCQHCMPCTCCLSPEATKTAVIVYHRVQSLSENC